MNENKFEIFNSAEFGSVRTLETTDGKVLFCGADVAKALGYSNAPDALSRHCKYIVKHDIPHPQSANKQIEMTFITEGDMYRLVAHSKRPDAERFEAWVFDEVLPTIRKKGSYTATSVQIPEDKAKTAEARLINARTRMANMYLKLANVDTVSKEYKNILVAKSAEVLAGQPLLPLPESEQKTYSAGDIAEMFGVSAQKVGRVANANNMKTDEYGCWYRDKSPHSNKEVDTFRYNDKAVEKFRGLL